MTAQALILPATDGAEIKRWAIAAAAVVAMHAGLIAGYLLLGSNEPEGAPDAPAVLIDLAPVSVAPQSQSDYAPGAETFEGAQMQTPPPQAKPEVADPIEKVEAPSDVTLPAPEPKAEEKQKEEPDREKVKTEVKRVQEQSPDTIRRAAPRSERQTALAPRAALQGAETANRDATKRWQHLVGARLQQQKQYPSSAEGKRGTVMLRFQLGRDGRVLSRNIARSSGVPAFDQEVLAMLQRAQPMPAFLPGMTQPTMTVTVPVEFAR
jgi:protein TonB